MLPHLISGAIGFILGAAFMTLLYERNVIGALRRSSDVRHISQLDVFELPEKIKQSIPPARKSSSNLPKITPKS